MGWSVKISILLWAFQPFNPPEMTQSKKKKNQHSCACIFFKCCSLLFLSPFHSRFWGWFSSTHLGWKTPFVADIDECALGGHTCHAGQDCDNTIGSYRCVVRCGIGFRRTSDGLSCQGIKMEALKKKRKKEALALSYTNNEDPPLPLNHLK